MKILIADDQDLPRAALAASLRLDPAVAVDAVADIGAAQALAVAQGPYDLVLLDQTMPGMTALAGLAALRAAAPGTPIGLLSSRIPSGDARHALAEGAAGFVPKSLPPASLVAAARFMVAGEVYAPLRMAIRHGKECPTVGTERLTPRETDVLRRLCRGLANKEIARELSLQEVTVKLHAKTLYRKIAARNRTHAALIAKEAGLFTAPTQTREA